MSSPDTPPIVVVPPVSPAAELRGPVSVPDVPAAASNGRPAVAATPPPDEPDPTPPYPLEANLEQLRFEVDMLKRQARLNALTGLCACLALLIVVAALRKQHARDTVIVEGVAGGVGPAAP